MKVRFARWLATCVTVFGVAVLAVGLALWLAGVSEGGLPLLLAGLGGTALGGAYFGPLPYFVITEKAVIVPIMFAGQGHTAIGRGDRLRVQGSRLVIKRIQGGEDR